MVKRIRCLLAGIAALTLNTGTCWAETAVADSAGRVVGVEVNVNPGKVLSMDSYERQWLKEDGTLSAEASLVYRPKEDGFARDYQHPTFTIGLRYSWNHATKMHREKSADWALLEPVDYMSELGNVVTAFAAFNRPLVSKRRWQAEYTLGSGVGYSHSKYNRVDGIDNELIGSRWLIYFSAELSATYFVTNELGVKAGLNFSHHSNGAMNRPNKGTNAFGPVVGVVVRNDRKNDWRQRADNGAAVHEPDFRKGWFGELTLGVGGKTLAEEWQRTQFGLPPDAEEYRTDRFRFYMAYSLQADAMYRYARRWASGMGVDIFYGAYSGRVAELNEAAGYSQHVSPWSVAIAAKYEVFYGNLSVRMGVGVYVFRQMGELVKPLEQPYYERIGIHYAFPKLGGLSAGFSVNAHRTKADFTELQVSVPLFP